LRIVNEALKKAARAGAKEPPAEKQGFNFSVKAFFIQTLFFRCLPVLFLVLLSVVFTHGISCFHHLNYAQILERAGT